MIDQRAPKDIDEVIFLSFERLEGSFDLFCIHGFSDKIPDDFHCVICQGRKTFLHNYISVRILWLDSLCFQSVLSSWKLLFLF